MSGTDQAIIGRSLELAAERAGDVTAEVYARYYHDCPAAATVMSHVDQHMQGRMLTEVLTLLLSEDQQSDAGYLDYEVENHRLSYSVRPEMYPALFHAVRDVVRAAVGPDWDAATEAAWTRRIDDLLGAIHARLPQRQRA
ncbi:MAG: globin [Pseudomonadales bacterium]